MPQPDLPITIRGYERRDNDRIRELTLEGFDGVSIDQNADALLGLDTEPLWRTRKWAGVKAELEASPSNHFVAVLDGEVIGYITTNPQPDAGIGQIPNMAVDARYRRRGVASRLIEHALEYLRSAACAWPRSRRWCRTPRARPSTRGSASGKSPARSTTCAAWTTPEPGLVC